MHQPAFSKNGSPSNHYDGHLHLSNTPRVPESHSGQESASGTAGEGCLRLGVHRHRAVLNTAKVESSARGRDSVSGKHRLA